MEEGGRNALVEAHLGLVRHVVRRFAPGGWDPEELFQSGCIGLIRAAERFDPDRGTRFSTFAVPLILGEIRQAIRRGGPLRVGRGLRQLATAARREEEALAQRLGREPTLSEVAESLGESQERLVEALAASREPLSLQQPAPGAEAGPALEERLPDEDEEGGIARRIEQLALRQALARLPERESRILLGRFVAGLTQAELGRRLGISQVQVHRLERRALARLRAAWNEGEP